MALKNIVIALIGLLGPRSGNAIHQDIYANERPTLPQIYQALRTATSEGLIQYNNIGMKNKRSRNIFRLTPKGYEELNRWLKEKPVYVPIKEPILQTLFFGNLIEKNVLIEILEAYRDAREKEAEYFKKESKKLNIRNVQHAPTVESNRFYWSIVIKYVLSRCDLDIAWTENVIQELKDSNLQSMQSTEDEMRNEKN